MTAEPWQKSGNHERYVYVQGIFDDLIFADTIVSKTKLRTDINVDQYRKAIDALYSDYRNVLIQALFDDGNHNGVTGL